MGDDWNWNAIEAITSIIALFVAVLALAIALLAVCVPLYVEREKLAAPVRFVRKTTWGFLLTASKLFVWVFVIALFADEVTVIDMFMLGLFWLALCVFLGFFGAVGGSAPNRLVGAKRGAVAAAIICLPFWVATYTETQGDGADIIKWRTTWPMLLFVTIGGLMGGWGAANVIERETLKAAQLDTDASN